MPCTDSSSLFLLHLPFFFFLVLFYFRFYPSLLQISMYESVVRLDSSKIAPASIDWIVKSRRCSGGYGYLVAARPVSRDKLPAGWIGICRSVGQP